MERKELVSKIFEMVDEVHPNMYHAIVKAEFENKKNEFIGNCENLTELEFDAGMIKLFALLKDGHTTYQIEDEKHCQLFIMAVGNDFYATISASQKYEKIISINGVDVKEVARRFLSYVSYETKEWRQFMIGARFMPCVTYLAMIGVANENDKEISILTEDGSEHICPIMKTDGERLIKKDEEQKKRCDNFYAYMMQDLLVVIYDTCKDVDGYTMVDFIQDLKKKCDEKLPRACILDVRLNTGGGSKNMNPLIYFLEQNKISTFVITNSGTFSSGRLTVEKAKRILNATILGTPTGGAIKCYGFVKRMELCGKKFSSSKKLIDLEKTFGYTGAILPDVYVPEDVEGMKRGEDAQMAAVVKYVREVLPSKKEKCLEMGE